MSGFCFEGMNYDYEEFLKSLFTVLCLGFSLLVIYLYMFS